MRQREKIELLCRIGYVLKTPYRDGGKTWCARTPARVDGLGKAIEASVWHAGRALRPLRPLRPKGQVHRGGRSSE